MAKIAPLMLDLDGVTLSLKEKEMLRHPFVGGVILFTRNYKSPAQITALTASIREVKPDILIAVDQEGGRVQRLKNGFTALPPIRLLGRLYDQDPQKACECARQCGLLMATEVVACGIDFSFAPVLDLDKGLSAVIGDRSFHGNSEVVAKLAAAYIKGMDEAGMVAIGKHYPGHGSVIADSHLALPVDERGLEEIEKDDLIPFRLLINQKIPALMTAHILYPNINNQLVTFSKYWLQDLLREKYQFSGVIFSDVLTMQGAHIINDIKDRVKLALGAGCDMILVCNDQRAVEEVLVEFSDYEASAAIADRLLPMRKREVQLPGETERESIKVLIKELENEFS
jgi:beta-N-acetylhexosaminidase